MVIGLTITQRTNEQKQRLTWDGGQAFNLCKLSLEAFCSTIHTSTLKHCLLICRCSLYFASVRENDKQKIKGLLSKELISSFSSHLNHTARMTSCSSLPLKGNLLYAVLIAHQNQSKPHAGTEWYKHTPSYICVIPLIHTVILVSTVSLVMVCWKCIQWKSYFSLRNGWDNLARQQLHNPRVSHHLSRTENFYIPK